MPSGSGPQDDAQWRRPVDGALTEPAARPTPGPPSYTGPPRTIAPPAGWKPPVVVQPAAARELPEQDTARLDAEEQSARTLTYGVAMIGGAIVLVLLLLLCGRAFF